MSTSCPKTQATIKNTEDMTHTNSKSNLTECTAYTRIYSSSTHGTCINTENSSTKLASNTEESIHIVYILLPK